MLRWQSSCAALVVLLAALWPQFARSAPPDSAPAKRSATPPASDEGRTGSLLNSTSYQQKLVAQLIGREVDAALLRAQQTLATSPAAVNQDLKTLLHQVVVAPELSAAERADLRRRLESALKECDRREAELEQHRLELQQARSAAEERARVGANLESRQQRVKQLIERFEALLSEGRYGLAEDVVSGLDADQTSTGDVIGPSALVNVRLAGAAREALAARVRRQKGVVSTLEKVETASVAMPGDEPIVYPEGERWQELTARRAKYARTDLHDSTPAEARLSKALNEKTNFDFTDITLADAVDYLKDLHGIEIQIDSKAIEEEGLNADAPVSLRLSGISLRSGLRLLLGALDLTYTIENEVLMITTRDRAAHRVVTKVYPVGELVLPIQTPNFSGGFGQLGGFSGQNRGGQQGGNASSMFNPMGQNQNGNGGGNGNGFGQNFF